MPIAMVSNLGAHVEDCPHFLGRARARNETVPSIGS
jgi:hypothetical protein